MWCFSYPSIIFCQRLFPYHKRCYQSVYIYKNNIITIRTVRRIYKLPKPLCILHQSFLLNLLQSSFDHSYLNLQRKLYQIFRDSFIKLSRISHYKSLRRRMCKQARRRCANRSCDNFAQILELTPCKDRPNCEIHFTRIPEHLRSGRHCSSCKGLSYQERKSQTQRIWREAHKEDSSARARERKRKLDGAEDSAHARAKKPVGSSIVREREGVVGGEFLLDSGNLSSIREETKEPLFPQEDNAVSSNFFPYSPKQGYTEPASDSEATIDDPTMVDALANEDDPPMKSWRDLAPVSRETSLGGITPASNDIPPLVVPSLYLASPSSMPEWEYPESRPPPPTLSEIISSFNAELAEVDAARTSNAPSLPHDDATTSDATGSSDPLLIPSPSNLMLREFPLNPLPSLQTLIDHAVFTMDDDHFTGADPAGVTFFWPESS